MPLPPAHGEYFQSPLRPSPAQLLTLNELLEGPSFLQRLISLAVSPITTLDDASKFLDKNWQRLSTHMFNGARPRSPRQMEQLILEIASSRSRDFALEFASQCSLTVRNEVLLPIPGLAEVELAHPEELRLARTGMRHESAFTLIMTARGYEVGIAFFPNSAMPARSTTVTGRAANQRPQAKSQVAARMSAIELVAAFDNRITKLLNEQLKISRSFTTTRFGDLQGRAVSGGLPSLPRRR